MKIRYFYWCIIFFLIFSSLLSCSKVYADGCFFSEYWDIYAIRQRAFIKYFDHIEELINQAAYQGEPQNFSWVVPLPGYPSIQEAKTELFQELHDFTKPTYPPSFCGGIRYTPTSGYLDVTVWETLTVGYYQVAILSSLSGESLIEWLTENDYVFPSEGQEILEFYAQKGFYFAAFKMQPGTKDEGNLDPVQFTFSTPTPFYPMRMTALSTQGIDVLLYIYAESPLQPDDPNFISLFDRYVKPSDFSGYTFPELGEICDRPGYLSKWERFFSSGEISDDIDIEETEITLGSILGSGTIQALLIVLLSIFIWWEWKRKNIFMKSNSN